MLICYSVPVAVSYVRQVLIVVRSVWLRVLLSGSVSAWLIFTVSNIIFIGFASLIVRVVWDNTCEGLDKTIAHEKA
jgi:hypothetical protein